MDRRVRPALLGTLLLTTCLLSLVLVAHSEEHQKTKKTRPASWATKLERPGLPNLHKVNDNLYRGAQPTAEGIAELEELGVKTIICLRETHTDNDILGHSKIAFEHIPVQTAKPTEKEVVRFLQIVTDKNRQPVFVHCKHGSDRTGMMCAFYRVVVDGWTKPHAIDEMTKGGFGFHPVWANLPKFIEQVDAEKLKDKAGMKK